MNRDEAARILDPMTSQQAIDELSCGGTNAKKLIIDLACRMGAEALRVERKEASIVMKTRHQYRSPDYEKPYCGACNHYVPDANAEFCCWCGARFVKPIPPLPEVEK